MYFLFDCIKHTLQQKISNCMYIFTHTHTHTHTRTHERTHARTFAK